MLMSFRMMVCFAAAAMLVPAISVSAGGKETPAEKIRKTLDQPIKLDYSGLDLQDVVNHLKKKTGVNFVLDQIGVFGGMDGPGMVFPAVPPAPGAAERIATVDLKSDGVKLSRALQRFLSQRGLAYAVLEDSVIITSQTEALNQQLFQLVSVELEAVPLQKALKDLTRSTPFNLVVDPRAGKEALTAITLSLENTSLESTVRLMVESAGLKTVRVDNALFITTEAHAAKMRNEQAVNGISGYGPYGPPPGYGATPVRRGGLFGVAPPAIRAEPIAPPLPNGP